MLDYLGSIKKGQKIRKGKNQTKSKDIALAKLHPIKPMLDSLDSFKKGRKIQKGENQTKSKDIAMAKLYY